MPIKKEEKQSIIYSVSYNTIVSNNKYYENREKYREGVNDYFDTLSTIDKNEVTNRQIERLKNKLVGISCNNIEIDKIINYNL